MQGVRPRQALPAAGIVPCNTKVGHREKCVTRTSTCTPRWTIGDVIVGWDPDHPDTGLNDGQLLPHAMNDRVLVEVLGGSFSRSGFRPGVVGVDNDISAGDHFTKNREA